ncbi:hypothetical protein [Peribacillus frigoritolerans]|uniref:hypothetical protein n=1 Tax=Peribacillus frigoritolerans TaxID=450367 RepID=UPI0025A019F1|nr:hypothetical protein [Peribacillus frigoritolerans]MDM5310649.1 hypothetical protein [Peribacillus frigoritolerans]
MGNQGSVGDVFGGCIQLDEMKHLKLENYINDGHFLASRREFIEKGYKKISCVMRSEKEDCCDPMVFSAIME